MTQFVVIMSTPFTCRSKICSSPGDHPNPISYLWLVELDILEVAWAAVAFCRYKVSTSQVLLFLFCFQVEILTHFTGLGSGCFCDFGNFCDTLYSEIVTLCILKLLHSVFWNCFSSMSVFFTSESWLAQSPLQWGHRTPVLRAVSTAAFCGTETVWFSQAQGLSLLVP